MRSQRKTDILSKVAEMQTEANRFGATIVPFRRFVLLTGYKLPKGVGVATGTLSSESKPAAKKAAEKPEAKEEKN